MHIFCRPDLGWGSLPGSIEALERYNGLKATFDPTDVSVLSAKSQCDCMFIVLKNIQGILLSRPNLPSQRIGRNLKTDHRRLRDRIRYYHRETGKGINESTDKHGKATTALNTHPNHLRSRRTAASSHNESQAEMMDILASARTGSVLSKVLSKEKTIKAA